MASGIGSEGRRRGRPAAARRGARPVAPRTRTLVNWSLYRAGWLAVLLPGLILLLATRTAGVLPTAPLPETFDGEAALQQTVQLARQHPDRSPGSAGAERAAASVEQSFRAAGLTTAVQRFEGRDDDGARVPLENVVGIARPAPSAGGVEPGSAREAVLVMAHRDADPPGPAANDNASGTGLLIELARALVGTASGLTVVVASTDGGTLDDAGARYLASHLPAGLSLRAAISVDAVARPGPLRLRLESDSTRTPAAGLVRSVVQGLRADGVGRVTLPPLGRQVLDLLAPLGQGEQAPFVTDAVPALMIDGSRPGVSSAEDTVAGLSAERLGRIGGTVQSLVLSLDVGPPPESPARSYLLSADRVVRGWTLQLLLLALAVPPLLAVFDLLTRTARLGTSLFPAARTVALHAAAPGAFLVLLRLEGALGLVPGTHEPPPLGAASGGFPLLALVAPLGAATGTWLALRGRSHTAGTDPAEAGVAGFTAALVAAAFAAVATLLSRPYALALVLPALHLWLALPVISRLGAVARYGLVALGWAGVAGLVALLAGPGGFGADAPLVLLRLAATGTVPFLMAFAGVLLFAGSALLVQLVSGRGIAPAAA